MKKSSAPADSVPQCALNSQDTPNSTATPHQREKSEKTTPKFPNSRNSGNNLHNIARQIKQEPPQYSEWPSSYDNSNTSWDSEWPTTPNTQFPKQSLGANSYKPRNPASYHSSSNDWSTGDSSNSSVPSNYAGMQATQQQQPASNCASASPSSYYENNNYYGGGYNYDSSYGGYAQPSYRSSYPPQQYPPPGKGVDSATGSYNGNRIPSGCPPSHPKQPVAEYNQRHPQYAMDPLYKAQIKREPVEYVQGEGDNFTSLFTKSLTSLYSEDPDNAYREEGNDPDIIVCTPPSAGPSGGEEHPSNYQRLMPTGNPYHPHHPPPNYPNPRHPGYPPYYDNRQHNAEPSSNVVDLEAGNDRSNSFRYDRPSFDNMHLYAPHNEPRPQPKRRKISMPHPPPDSNYPTESRRKVPRKRSIKSDSQWTPNSYVPFGNIQIKQEPEDDYMSIESEQTKASNQSSQDKSFSSNGTSGRSPSQQSEHHKPAPRKRSPASTCFDRFEKKSTPLSKKVSPLSVYAKVQESVVLSVKCRRYKKRTKPANAKEEVVVYPGKEEIENWKKSGAYNQTPDQAVRILMRDLLERVSQTDRRQVSSGPDLTEVDPFKLQELLYQFCQRYSLDFRDFEDIHSVLQPRLIKDKSAKNSERASAIRKRTSASPAQAKSGVGSVRKRASKRSSNDNCNSAAKRLLRNLPGREPVPEEELFVTELRPTRRRSRKAPVVREQDSTKSEKEVDDKEKDTAIESSTDHESEAGKEAEVRKKSERLKQKHPVTEMLADDKQTDKSINQTKEIKKVEKASKSKERSKEREKSKDRSKERDKSKEETSNNSTRKWTRDQNNCGSVLRSASIEIVDITVSDSPSSTSTSKNGSEADFDVSTNNIKRSTRRTRNSTKSTSRERPDKSTSETAVVKGSQRQQEKKADNKENQSQKEKNKSNKSKKDPKENSEKTNSSPNHEETSKNKKVAEKINLPTRSPSRRNRIPKKLDFPINDFAYAECKNSKEDKNFENVDISIKKDTINIKAEKGKSKNSSSKNKKQEVQKNDIEEESTSQDEVTIIKISDDIFSNKDTKSRKSRLLGRSTRDRSVLNTSKPDSEFEDNPKSKINSKEEKIEATEDGKLSALQENKRSNSETSNKSAKKPHSNPIKEEYELHDLPSVPKTSSRKQSEYPIKKRERSVQIAVNKPIVAKRDASNEGSNAKAANSSARLPQKKSRQRNVLSQSDSEPQVVLMKLPDVHINSTMGSIPLEYFERFVSKEKNRSFVSEEHKGKNSDDNSSVGSPPVLVSMKDIDKERDAEKKMAEMESSSKTSFDMKDDSTPLPLIHFDDPMNSEHESHVEEKPKLLKELRYSADSEDSDCALVIDLDRRMSIEEETPAPVSKDSSTEKETKESVISKDTSDDQTPTVPSTENGNETSCGNSDSSNKPQSDKSAEPQLDITDDEDFSIEDLENVEKLVEETLPTLFLKAEKIKRELPCFSDDQPLNNLIKKVVESNTGTAKDSKEQTRVESILRSALTQKRIDGSTGSSQSASNSEDSKLQFLEDFAKMFWDGEEDDSFSTDSIALDAKHLSDEVQKTYDDMKFALELLPDFNVKVSDNEDLIYDSKYIKDKLEKLKHEIMRLRSLANKKEKERFNMICFQKYLKGCIKSFMTEHGCEGIKQEVDENDDLSALIPDIQTLYLVARRLIRITTLALSIAKSGAMALLKLCPLGKQLLAAEKLIPVETMVADATENYGVDLRIVKNGSPAPKPTILETVLTSKEPTFNQSTLEKVPKEESPERIPHLIPKTDSSPKKKIPSSRDSPFRPYSSTSSTDTDKSESSSLQLKPRSSNSSPDHCKSESSSHQFRKRSSTPSSESKSENSSHQFRPYSSISPLEPNKSENSSSPFGLFGSNFLPESSKSANSSHPTILQQALSKEKIHSQSSSHSLPASSSIKSHPSTSPAIPSTSYQEDTPLDFSKEGKSPSSVSLPSSYASDLYKEEKLKSSVKPYPKPRSNVSYSMWKKSQAIKHNKPPTSALNLKVDCPKAEETAVITRGPAAKTFSTHSPTSQTVMMKPSTSHHQVMSPKLIPYQQRPERADHLIGSHRSLPSEGDRLHPQSLDSSNPGENHLKGNSNQFYSQKIKEAHQLLSYSSGGSTSDAVRVGVAHQRNPTQNFMVTKPSGMHSPSHSPYSCNGCGALGAKFLCSGCRDHWYCSAQCQNLRWPEHRLVCPGFMYSNSARQSPTQNSSSIDQ